VEEVGSGGVVKRRRVWVVHISVGAKASERAVGGRKAGESRIRWVCVCASVPVPD
jgi:hypothetical protein